MEAVNKRQSEFDYAKTFAIFFMVIIHVIEEMSTVNTEILPTGTLNNLVQFFAGPILPPVFLPVYHTIREISPQHKLFLGQNK